MADKLITLSRLEQSMNKIIAKINGNKPQNPLPIANGGTGAKDASNALYNLGAAAKSHYHLPSDISGIIPITMGGTGNRTGYVTVGKKEGTEVEKGSTAEGYGNTASGSFSHAEGYACVASGAFSHTEGVGSTSAGRGSHAEGDTTTSTNEGSHAEGYQTKSNGKASHAEGERTNATGRGSHAEGYDTVAKGDYSHAAGKYTIANGAQYVIGSFNKDTEFNIGTSLFIVGGASGSNYRSNCFRVGSSGVWGGTYKSSGADYAEMFEWEDGNPNNEDRVGRFVTLIDDKIAFTSDIGNILGITSAAPSVCADTYDDQWQGMYMVDVFGRPIYEDVIVPAVMSEDGEMVIIPEHTEHRQKINPDYKPDDHYEGRSSRKEWSPVGIVGKLVMLQDGTITSPGQFVKPGIDGIGTKSNDKTNVRVMKVIDDSHIRVFIVPSI